MPITLTGTVTKKVLTNNKDVEGNLIVVTISLDGGPDITETIALNQESTYPMGSTITLTQS